MIKEHIINLLNNYRRNIKINITDNRHFTLVYLLGITRLTFTQSTAQEPSIFVLWNALLDVNKGHLMPTN